MLAGLYVTFSRKEREDALRPDGTQSPAEGLGQREPRLEEAGLCRTLCS